MTAGFWHSCFHGQGFFTLLGLIAQLQHVGFDEFMNSHLMLISLSREEKTCHVICKFCQTLLGVLSKVKLFSAHALEKRCAGNWQQLATVLEEVENCHKGSATRSTMGPPSATGMGVPGWHWFTLQGRWSLEAVLTCMFSATCCFILFHLSRAEQPCPCQKPDSSPIRFVFLLPLCRQTAFTVLLWVQIEFAKMFLFSGSPEVSLLFACEHWKYMCSPWQVAGTVWPCLHPYLLE